MGFIAHPNPQIRLTAAQNLVPYSTSDPVIFKSDKLRPIRNLKVLTRDRPVRFPPSEYSLAPDGGPFCCRLVTNP